jgi:hypothetical protein
MTPAGIALHPEGHALRAASKQLPYGIWETIEGAEISTQTRDALCHEHPPIFVWKVAVFADRSEYNRCAEPKHMVHCRAAFGDPRRTYPVPRQIPEDRLERIRSTYCFGDDPRVTALRSFIDSNKIDVWGQSRDIDVSFIGRTDYPNVEPPLDAALLTKHRRAVIPAIKKLGLNVVATNEAVPPVDYYELLLRSKIVVSPYGVGESCLRDWEAVFAGCVLVKPRCDHVERFPLHFECAADFGVLNQIVTDILGQYSSPQIQAHLRAARGLESRECSQEARLDRMIASLKPIL